MAGKNKPRESAEKREEKPFADLMGSYQVRLVGDVTFDREKLFPREENLPKIVHAVTRLEDLNQGGIYDFSVNICPAGLVAVSQQAFAVYRGYNPKEFLEVLEKKQLDFVREVRNGTGHNQVYVALPRDKKGVGE